MLDAMSGIDGTVPVVSRSGDDDADPLELREEFRRREVDAIAGDRLQLVERATRETESTPAHLRDRQATRRDERRDHERRLVADAAGGVLVHDAAEPPQVEALARRDHRCGQLGGLTHVHAPPDHRHAERGHLVIGDLPVRVAVDEEGDLGRGETLAVALFLDEPGRPHGQSAIRPGRPLPSGSSSAGA